MKIRQKKIQELLIWIYLIGAIGLSVPYTRRYFIYLIPVNLILAIILLLYYHQRWNLKFIFLAVFTIAASFLIEMLGVETGEIFGDYTYGKALGIKWHETPVIIGINWLLLLYCTYTIAKRIRIHFLFQVLIAALLMTVYDFFLEPVADKLDMWHWQNRVIPLQNYAAWFGVSLIFLLLFHFLKTDSSNKIARPLYIIQLVFFMILYLTLGFI